MSNLGVLQFQYTSKDAGSGRRAWSSADREIYIASSLKSIDWSVGFFIGIISPATYLTITLRQQQSVVISLGQCGNCSWGQTAACSGCVSYY